MTRRTREQVIRHLIRYKESVLEVSACGTWNAKEYRHILPETVIHRNLIESPFSHALEAAFNGIGGSPGRVHRGFAHLNSSQALALNLFVPLEAACRLDIVLESLGESDSALNGVPEYVEDPTEGTNFDYLIRGTSKKFFFEVKYTEDRFGSAKNDESHRKKFGDVYEQRLAKVAGISREEFFRDYQLWRNIIYTDTGMVVFVFPRFRTDLQDAINHARHVSRVPDRIRVILIDDLVDRALRLEPAGLRNHFAEFSRKYLEFDAGTSDTLR
jgi:hypothetical protein